MPKAGENIQCPPAERTPEFTRESFLRPPDWRWQEAKAFIEAELCDEFYTLPEDPVVHMAVRILRGVYSRFSLLIEGYSPKAASDTLKFISPLQYELYGKLFFDLSGVRAVSSWMEDFVLNPKLGKETKLILRSRWLSYYEGGKSGVESALTGKLSPGARKLLAVFTENERAKQVFDYMTSSIKLPAVEYATLMEQSIKSAQDRQLAMDLKEAEEKETPESLRQLAENIQEGIRHYTQAEKDGCSGGMGNGLDFNNKYINIITGAAKAPVTEADNADK